MQWSDIFFNCFLKQKFISKYLSQRSNIG